MWRPTRPCRRAILTVAKLRTQAGEKCMSKHSWSVPFLAGCLLVGPTFQASAQVDGSAALNNVGAALLKAYEVVHSCNDKAGRVGDIYKRLLLLQADPAPVSERMDPQHHSPYQSLRYAISGSRMNCLC